MDNFRHSMQRTKIFLLGASVGVLTLCFYLSPSNLIDNPIDALITHAAPLTKHTSSTTLVSTDFHHTDWMMLKAKRSELNLISFLYGQPQPESLEDVSATTSSQGGFHAAAGKIFFRPLQIDLQQVTLNGTPFSHMMTGSIDELKIDLQVNPFAIQANGFNGNLDALD
jgi:hypothetical protein